MDQAHLTKRLSFIRYLYQLGVEQSRAAAPKAYAALFTFHDSIELFLVVAGEHCRSSAKTSDSFWRYWESIDGKLQPDKSLTNKREIDRLVRARNSFKHAFILPSLEQIEEYRTTTRIFFESNTFNIFERDFHHLTMADLVQNETVKTKLKKAEEHIANHEYKEALIETDHAFKLTTISIYRDLRIDHRRIEPRFDYDVRGISGEALRMIGEAFARSLADLKTDLLREIVVIGYGVSYSDLRRYKAVAPNIQIATVDPVNTRFLPRELDKRSFSEDDCAFCLRFVVETVLRLESSPVSSFTEFGTFRHF